MYHHRETIKSNLHIMMIQRKHKNICEWKKNHKNSAYKKVTYVMFHGQNKAILHIDTIYLVEKNYSVV